MNPANRDFLSRAFLAAKQSGHIFPEMAACEAALESGYGRSQLAVQDRNLFGMKQHQHPIYGTHVLPTREFLGDKWVTVSANWITYPNWETCFADRMATLKRLAAIYPHYAAALAAGSATTYVMEVSQSWSTDPERGNKVLAIYDNCAGDWSATES
jgi:flagellum-specific peptidoglycan hydrolase FlgJ